MRAVRILEEVPARVVLRVADAAVAAAGDGAGAVAVVGSGNSIGD